MKNAQEKRAQERSTLVYVWISLLSDKFFPYSSNSYIKFLLCDVVALF